jgi:hypothetical protein
LQTLGSKCRAARDESYQLAAAHALAPYQVVFTDADRFS